MLEVLVVVISKVVLLSRRPPWFLVSIVSVGALLLSRRLLSSLFTSPRVRSQFLSCLLPSRQLLSPRYLKATASAADPQRV